jgi:DNA-binding GntR family transcriptional regulator
MTHPTRTAQVAPIKIEPVASQVTEVIRQWILTGRLAAGHHIRQEAIASELGVSRVPVREALLTLEAEGLIVRKKYKGAYVAGISLAEVKETYQLRDLLESFLFEKALPHITADVLKRAEEIIRQSDEARPGEDWMRLNIEFHLTLYEPAQLPVTMQTLKSMLRRTDRYFRLQQAISPTLQQESRTQHQSIVDIIRSGDGGAALHAMRQHIHVNADEIARYLEDRAREDRVHALPAQESA